MKILFRKLYFLFFLFLSINAFAQNTFKRTLREFCVLSLLFLLTGIVSVTWAADETVNGKLTVDQNSSSAVSLQVEGVGTSQPLATFTRDSGAGVEITTGANNPSIRFDDYYNGLWAMGMKTSDDSFRLTQSSSIYNNENNFFVVKKTGEVGLGTASPAYKLDIRPANGNARFQFASTNNDYPRLRIGGDSTTIAGVINRTQNGADLYFGESGDSGDYLFRGSGNFWIGTSTPDYKLDVLGTIRAKEIIVESSDWSDFVFEDDYDLPTLDDVSNFIKANGHLPNIPSAEEVAENGITLGNMNSKLLQKIEELTLYALEQQETIRSQQAILENQAKRLEVIEKLLTTSTHD